jgi:hypothetical protein
MERPLTTQVVLPVRLYTLIALPFGCPLAADQ